MHVGDILQKRYKLHKKNQSAWLAEDVRSQTMCLLKPVSAFVDPEVVEWLAAVWYPGIPRVHDHITGPDGQSWVTLEYMPGKPLKQEWNPESINEDRNQVLLWMTQCSRLLTFLHNHGNQPLAHLDIKPDHLLLTDTGQISLIDFGAARIFRQPSQSLSSHLYDIPLDQKSMPGISLADDIQVRQAMTPVFAAPEQLFGSPCPASDIYALGLSMICLLTGKSPSAARNMEPAQLLQDQPTELHRIFEQCLQQSPALRYDSAEMLTAALEQYMLTDVKPLTAPTVVNGIAASPASGADSQPAQAAIQLDSRREEKRSEQRDGQIICVWDGAEFGCELAAVMAEKETVLLIESDWFSPKADLLLGISAQKNWLTPRQPLLGLDQVLVAQQQERLDAKELDRLCESGRLAGLQTLRPHCDLHHYEYYPSDAFYHVIMLARSLYKNIILLCNQFIYDSYTCIGLMAADKIVIPLAANMASFRGYTRSIAYLQDKSILRKDNIHFVAFSYNSSQDLSWGSMNALSGDRMLGCISEQKQRRLKRSGKKPYAAVMAQQSRDEYQSLIKQLSRQ